MLEKECGEDPELGVAGEERKPEMPDECVSALLQLGGNRGMGRS